MFASPVKHWDDILRQVGSEFYIASEIFNSVFVENDAPCEKNPFILMEKVFL